jgi:hypothetical protein
MVRCVLAKGKERDILGFLRSTLLFAHRHRRPEVHSQAEANVTAIDDLYEERGNEAYLVDIRAN